MDNFDRAAAESAKAEALERVDRAANPRWKIWITWAIVEVARGRPTLTTDDIERLRQRYDGPTTHESRALGPIMRQAQRDGVIAPTDRWEQSAQRCNHRRPQRVWRSLIYKVS